MKAGTTTVVTGFLVPLPATRSESVFSKILLILNNLKKIMKSFANAYHSYEGREIVWQKKMRKRRL